MKRKAQVCNKIKDGQVLSAWLLSSPALIIIFIFMIIPFGMAVVYSFTNKMLVDNPNNPTRVVFFDNYIKLFENEVARTALLNTFYYTIMVVPAFLLLATLLALLINRKLRGMAVFRVIYFCPQVVTMTVVAVIWAFLLSPNETGLFNSILSVFGVPQQLWLKDPNLSMPSIAFMSVWQNLGLQTIIVLGGLQYIPQELYEASRIDGLTKFQQLRYITIPLLKNTLTYVVITNTISSLKLFTQVFVLTNGGPKNSTISVIYLIYQAGFTNSQIGYASSIAVIFFLLVLSISLFQQHVLGREKA